MTLRDTHRSIQREAAQWAARLDRAPLSAQEAAVLDGWLLGDVRRQGALLRAQAILVGHAAPAVARMPVVLRPVHGLPVSLPADQHRTARKRWMRLGGALAASVVVGMGVLSTVQMPTAYATVKGEIRSIPLVDGSTVTLNTDSRIQVYAGKGPPRIKVTRGEVLVQAVADTRRPLRIEVDGLQLHATQAVFSVGKLDSLPLQVTVHDGRVELEGQAEGAATVLAPHARWSMATSDRRAVAHASPVSADEIDRQWAWREGKLAFHGETLAEAAKRFARYSDTRIVVADPVLANAHVIGLYAARNPVGFARAAAKVLDAKVEHSAGQVVISLAD